MTKIANGLYKLSDPRLLEDEYFGALPMGDLKEMGIARRTQ